MTVPRSRPSGSFFNENMLSMPISRSEDVIRLTGQRACTLGRNVLSRGLRPIHRNALPAMRERTQDGIENGVQILRDIFCQETQNEITALFQVLSPQ